MRSLHMLTAIYFMFFSSVALSSTLSFSDEAERATKQLNCPTPKFTGGGSSLGTLYGCIVGKAETVKYFINEIKGTGEVKNIKLMWNDWFVDIGDGIHADKDEARAFVDGFSKMYAPGRSDELWRIFTKNEDVTLQIDDYEIAYTYYRGPKIDQRLFVLTPGAVLSRENNERTKYEKAFNACREVTAAKLGYAKSLFSGDGVPIVEDGRLTFMLSGKNKDVVFCEIHKDGHYRLKASLGGQYPFKYIAKGVLLKTITFDNL